MVQCPGTPRTRRRRWVPVVDLVVEEVDGHLSSWYIEHPVRRRGRHHAATPRPPPVRRRATVSGEGAACGGERLRVKMAVRGAARPTPMTIPRKKSPAPISVNA